jgi:hypothetical protein
MGTIIIFPVIDSAVDTPAIVGLGNSAGRGAMSALGQKQTYAVQQPMSALLPIATAKAAGILCCAASAIKRALTT